MSQKNPYTRNKIMTHYSDSEIISKLKYYKSLPEKARRHFLALEYERLGFGSQRYLSSIFGCSRNTITRGSQELKVSSSLDYTRQRKPGGGRKKKSFQ